MIKQKLEQAFQDFIKDNPFSGTCLINDSNSILLEKNIGFAHRGFQIENQMDTMFDVASVTKIFTATAILQLVESGKLNLDDKITELLDLAGTQIPTDVTIRHLLTHTSGIADDAEEERGESYADLFVDSPNYKIRKLEDFLPNFVHKEPNFKAGTSCMYNNCAFILLGLAIEKLSSLTYKDYMQQFIFSPCGMKRTAFCAMDEINESLAENYVAILDEEENIIDWKKNIYSYPPIGGTDGGLCTTVADLCHFAHNLSRVLTPNSIDLLLHPQCEFSSEMNGWNFESKATACNSFGCEVITVQDKTLCIMKDGMNEGVSAYFAYYPEKDIALAIASNQCDNVWKLQRLLRTVVYNEMYG